MQQQLMRKEGTYLKERKMRYMEGFGGEKKEINIKMYDLTKVFSFHWFKYLSGKSNLNLKSVNFNISNIFKFILFTCVTLYFLSCCFICIFVT